MTPKPNSRTLLLLLIAMAGLGAPELRAVQQTFWPANQWPPTTWRFATVNDGATAFPSGPNTTLLRRLELTNLFNPIIPPASGLTNVYSYANSRLKNELSQDFGANWLALQAEGPIQMRLIHTADVGGSRQFDLELLQLDLAGPLPPFAIYRIQVDPFLPSIGQVVITSTNGGYLISGFINAQLQLQIGNLPFGPAQSSTYLELTGPPGTPAVLSVTPAGAGNVQVCWTTQTNVQYQLQWTDSVTSTNWINLGGALPGTTTNLCVTDAVPSQTNRYYRVHLSP